MAYTAINPYNGEVIQEFSNTTDNEIHDILNQAENYYQKEKSVSFSKRAELLKQLADEFENHLDDYARLASTNMGKLIGESRTEVEKIVSYARYFAEQGPKFLQQKNYDKLSVGSSAHVEFSGIGIVLAVEPWNFPFTQVMRVFAPNFMLGNPVILKHASIVPQAAQSFADACQKAGLPQGAFANIFATHGQIDKIIDDPRVQGFALTGSERAGRNLATKAAKNLMKTTLELGGTDIFAVLPDADIDKAAKDAAEARLANAGQVCTAAKRYLVSDEVYDEFLDKVKQAFDSYQFGNPLDEKTTLAQLSSQSAKDNLQEQVEKVVAGGSEILYGDLTKNEGPGFQFSPLILTGMTHDNPMYDEELFGPVAQIYRVSSEEEMIKIANDSRYGLGGAIYTADVAHGNELATKIETGQVAINQVLDEQAEVPFGGVKDSGYGRELSDWGLFEFANVKLVLN